MADTADELADLSQDRYELQARYLDLVRVELPHAARTDRGGRWCVTEDHCFMRIVLDHVCGGCWYDHLDRRLVGYKQLSVQQLARAVELAEAMLEGGPPVAWTMHAQSLRWRGKIRSF